MDNGLHLDALGALASQVDPSTPFVAEAADDFVLPGTLFDGWDVTELQVWYSALATPADWLGVHVTVYADTGLGIPDGTPNNDGTHNGNVVHTEFVPISEVTILDSSTQCSGTIWHVQVPIASLTLPGGIRYWLVASPRLEWDLHGQTYQSLSNIADIDNPAVHHFENAGIPDWTVILGNSGSCPNAPPSGTHREIAFRLYGEASNDFCAGAELIECNSPIITDNTLATTDVSDPGFSCHFDGPGTQGQNTLWYRFVASDTTALVDTCRTTDPQADDSLLAVYEGTCGSLTEIGCSEDECGLLSSVCVEGLTIGQTYYIQLASYRSSNVGPYTLRVLCPCPEFQFNYDATAITSQISNAGAVHIPGEFWVSRWASSDLFRINDAGALLEGPFTVPGVTGIRGMTWDGSLIWAANATTTLYGIDPATKTVVDTITNSVGQTARFVTYDETAPSENGAFWIGDWDSSLYLIRYDGGAQGFIDGVLLEDIPNRYGCVVDNISDGGPYYWFFHQSPPPGETDGTAWISRYTFPFLIDNHVSVSVALGEPSTSLAGGLFITSGIVPGQWTIGGILQQGGVGLSDRLFGLKLDVPPCPADITDSSGLMLDRIVNLFDLLLLLDNWGSNGPGAAISSDGGGATVVDLFDLLAMLDAWGDCQ